MLDMQEAMNSLVHPDWRAQDFSWYRAIWVECAELLDHYGWKWWKKQSPDIEQVKLELVDIWHFGMSQLLLTHPERGKLIDLVTTALGAGYEGKGFYHDLENFTLHTLKHHDFDIEKFALLLAAADLDFDELFARYVSKNVLNSFRQDHGYQEGVYQKNWQGREDNEHLVELVARLDTSSPQFKDDLYTGLSRRYRETTG
jgi:hypothetical protein